MTNGQLVIGSTGATPVVASLTAGTGNSITNAAGSITVGTSNPYRNYALSVTPPASDTTTSTSYVDIPSVTVTTTAAGTYLLLFEGVFTKADGNNAFIKAQANGVDITNSERAFFNASITLLVQGTMGVSLIIPTGSIGSGQVVKLQWKIASGSALGICGRSLSLVYLGP
jgi:hypothetical protein